jgi:hypothetical protein
MDSCFTRQAGSNGLARGGAGEGVATALDAKQRRMLQAEVRKVEQKHRQGLAARHAQENKDLESGRARQFSSIESARVGLKEKHQLERKRLDKQMQLMDDDLHQVLNGQHENFHGSVADQSQLPSQTLMSSYNTEAARLQQKMDSKKRKDQNELQAKIAEKRRQMAERITSVERILHVHAPDTRASATLKVEAQAQQNEVAAMKEKLSQATAKMERVLHGNTSVKVLAPQSARSSM